MNRTTGKYRWIKKYWSEEENNDGKHGGKANRMRGNDGAVDCKGRFWVGTMNDPLVTDPTDEGTVAGRYLEWHEELRRQAANAVQA